MVMIKIDARYEHSNPSTTRIFPIKIDSKHHCHRYQGCEESSFTCYKIITLEPGLKKCIQDDTYTVCQEATKTVCGAPSAPYKADAKWLHSHSVTLPGSTITCYTTNCTSQVTKRLVNNTTTDQVYE